MQVRKIGIAAFTDKGRALAEQISLRLSEDTEILWYQEHLKSWCADCFAQASGILFIGACGIAVRTIAPFLKSKTTDPAVLVMDEKGQFVISLLSGHLGGANELTAEIAELTGAVPVITTASDVNGKTAVDVLAKKNGLKIGSMSDAKKMAAAIVRGEQVGIWCSGQTEGKLPEEFVLLESPENISHTAVEHLLWISEQLPKKAELQTHLSGRAGIVLHLIPRNVVLGIGCRRNKTEEEIIHEVSRVLEEESIPEEALVGAASIDLKKEEQGILALCKRYGISFTTYTANELAQAEGEFEPSEFVKRTTGVDNVCERAALLAAGKNARLIRKKYAANGITVALAVREWKISFEK